MFAILKHNVANLSILGGAGYEFSLSNSYTILDYMYNLLFNVYFIF